MGAINTTPVFEKLVKTLIKNFNVNYS